MSSTAVSNSAIIAEIPAEIYMISACMDNQDAENVSNTSEFDLPNAAGPSRSACTSAFLEVNYADKQKPTTDVSWLDTLNGMRQKFQQDGFAQITQLSSSRLIDVQKPVSFVPTNSNGCKRAVLIGINYVGQSKALTGSHNDVLNMKEYLIDVCQFNALNIHVLMDDGTSTNPTRQNITSALSTLVQSSKAGDVSVIHYSGHGDQLPSQTNPDGYDDTICPVDFTTAGEIRDVELYDTVVTNIAKGVYLSCLFDCCHSGSMLNLPYMCAGNGTTTNMVFNPDFILSP